MISVVICSVNSTFLKNISKNIEKGIGTSFEILSFDNTIEKKGICKIYNSLATIAKFDIICLIHEDVEFQTIGWGKIIIDAFKDPSIGLVGLSGSTYRPKVPVAWSQIPNEFYRTSIPYCFNNTSIIYNPHNEIVSEVKVIDGFFMATRKSVWQKIEFNETLCGFHFYDMAYSLSVGEKSKVVVRHDIKAEHFSAGNLNNEWFESSKVFYNLYKNKLPKYTNEIPPKKIKEIEHYASISYIFTAINLQRKFIEYFSFWLKALFLSPLNKNNLKVVHQLLKNKVYSSDKNNI